MLSVTLLISKVIEGFRRDGEVAESAESIIGKEESDNATEETGREDDPRVDELSPPREVRRFAGRTVSEILFYRAYWTDETFVVVETFWQRLLQTDENQMRNEQEPGYYSPVPEYIGLLEMADDLVPEYPGLMSILDMADDVVPSYDQPRGLDMTSVTRRVHCAEDLEQVFLIPPPRKKWGKFPQRVKSFFCCSGVKNPSSMQSGSGSGEGPVVVPLRKRLTTFFCRCGRKED